MIGEHFLTLIMIALALLAIADLMVGVSNDAVNFLNSAVGSKALSLRNILIIAGLGIIFGTLFSGGIMEVARKGIFVPSQFYFDEIMVIFISVMITDVLMLDFFNTLGVPTSTTVSVVFGLLGASFCVAFIKILNKGDELLTIFNYVNTEKANQIIIGILLSVFIAFISGMVVQFIVRLVFTFRFEARPKYISILFGGLASTFIVYFMLIKGINGATFLDRDVMAWIKTHALITTLVLFPVLSLFSWGYVHLFKKSIYKFIIIIGTFSLAMAFAGNDLVNFIGVPMAAWQAYESWQVSGVPSSEFNMSILEKDLHTPTIFLILSGVIMMLTLWFSKKARHVIKTELNLSDQNDIRERFSPNFFSRMIVRVFVLMGDIIVKIMPKGALRKIDKRFAKQKIHVNKDRNVQLPSFDVVRAAVNLMLSGMLISFATSMKLPLSTTYVTFMVAMGTSFSDKAWGLDSAVYRVAGVFNIIGSWFLTAVAAFISAALITYLIYLGGNTVIAILLIVVLAIAIRNYLTYKKKTKAKNQESQLNNLESDTIQGIIQESTENVSKVIHTSQKIFENAITGTSEKNLSILKSGKSGVEKLSKEVDSLQNNVFYFIKKLEETPLESSRFYILIVRYLEDLVSSVEYISKITYKHVNNNHKGLTFRQIKDLKEVEGEVAKLMKAIRNVFHSKGFHDIDSVLALEESILELINQKIEAQIMRTSKSDESSPKNTKLYFNILLETKEMATYSVKILDIYSKEGNKALKNHTPKKGVDVS